MQTEQEKNILLASVSRSFYLTIRALPKPLRQPVRTAYLLARAADTIADTVDIPVPDRLTHLQRLRAILANDESPERSIGISAAISPFQSNHAEKILITHLPEVMAEYATLDPADHADVKWVLEQITDGQEQDLLTPQLTSDAQLERYTWLVAGCVGEFWTRLGVRKFTGYATLPDSEMLTLGADFGKGLQLVNILRDLPADLANGRNYLPDLADYGRWKERSEQLLDNGWKYVLSLRQARLRFACALPVLLGLRTLSLLGPQPPQTRLKVSRAEVRALFFQTALRCGSRSALEKYRRSLGCLAQKQESSS